MIGVCDICRRRGKPFWRSIQLNIAARDIGTQYVREEDNYVACCKECHGIMSAYIEELYMDLHAESLASCRDSDNHFANIGKKVTQ